LVSSGTCVKEIVDSWLYKEKTCAFSCRREKQTHRFKTIGWNYTRGLYKKTSQKEEKKDQPQHYH